MAPDGHGGPALALALLRAADWFDEALRSRLAAHGTRLTRSQARVFAGLGPDGASIAELARTVGVTRQSMHRQVAELVALGLLTTTPDPTDARASVVRRTGEGAALVRRAAGELEVIEAELAGRIGAGRVAALRAALAEDWGPPPP